MLDTAAIAELMGRTSLFGVLSEEARLGLAGTCRVRKFRRGQLVFSEGDESTSLVIVAEGRVKVAVHSPDGAELMLNIMEPEGVAGDVGIIDGGPRSATAETLTEAVIVFAPADAVRDLMKSEPFFSEQMSQRMAALVRRLTGTTSDLVFLDLPKRVAKMLVTACEENGGNVADLGLTQSEVGARLGASRQSVNTALRNFARRGLIDFDHHQVRVLDLPALGRLAAGR